MKRALLPISVVIMLSVYIYSCSSDDDNSGASSVVQTQEPETPAPTQYTLTVSAGEGGSVSTEGGKYDEGTEITVTATPSEGYKFIGWEGNNSLNQTISFTLNSNSTIEALFEFICLSEEPRDYLLPSYHTFKISHPLDLNQVAQYPTHYLHKYGTEKIMLDYNGDGFLDLVSYENDYNNNDNRQLISFFLGDCEGNMILDDVNSNKFYGLIHGRKILLGDYNNDTYPDIFLIGHGWDYPPFSGEYPVLLQNSASGEFTEKRLTEFSNFFHGGSSGDFDNDGDLDVLLTTASMYEYAFMVLENDGLGNFTEFKDLGLYKNQYGKDFINGEMFDINEDGILDFFFMSAKEGEESMGNGTQDVYYSSQVLIGNGINFEGQVYTIPLAGEWDQVYDADFYDLDGNGSIEIITNRIRNSQKGWYIQILELIDGEYVDNTYKFMQENKSETGFWNVYLEISDYDKDGVIELRNNIPKQVEDHELLYSENPRFFYHEWELINGELIKVD